MSGCLRPHGQQHARLPCPSLSPEVYSDSQLCCPLLFLPSIFPSIRVFSNESALSSGGQSVGASASASVSPMHIQGWFPLGLDWFNLPVVQRTVKSLHYNLKASVLWCLTLFMVQLYLSLKVAQSCLNLFDPMDCCPPGSSVHGVLLAGILKWVAIPFSREPSRRRDQTHVPHCRQILSLSEPPRKPMVQLYGRRHVAFHASISSPVKWA